MKQTNEHSNHEDRGQNKHKIPIDIPGTPNNALHPTCAGGEVCVIGGRVLARTCR